MYCLFLLMSYSLRHPLDKFKPLIYQNNIDHCIWKPAIIDR